MSIDELTKEMVSTLDKFEPLGMNTEARRIWTETYQYARAMHGTDYHHAIDEEAYATANRQLQQYYNSLRG